MPLMSDAEFEALGGPAPSGPASQPGASGPLMSDQEFEALGAGPAQASAPTPTPLGGPPMPNLLAASPPPMNPARTPESEKTNVRRKLAVDALGGPAFADASRGFGDSVQDWFVEMDMARSDKPDTVYRKFRDRFPLGVVINVPTSEGVSIWARKNPEEPFRELNVSPKIAAALISEPTVLGAAGGMATSGPVGSVIGGTLGTVAGVYGQEAVEHLRGYGEHTAGEMATRAAREGGIALGTGALVSGIFRLYGAASGTRDTLDVIAAQRRQGLAELGRGQVGGPFIRGLYRQVGATTARIEEQITRQGKSLLEAFRRQGDNVSPDAVSNEALLNVMAAQKQELDKLIMPRAISLEGAGAALQTGIESWKKIMFGKGGAVDRAYAEALELGDDASFDLSGVQKVADEAAVGVRGAGEEVVERESVEFFPDSDVSRPVKTQGVEDVGVQVSGNLPGELNGILRDIKALKPIVTKYVDGTGTWGAYEQMKALRTRLYDLKESDDGLTRRWAGKLWSELSEAMNHPLSANNAFHEAYRAANTLYKSSMETLEKSYIAQALGKDTPENVARRYLNPGYGSELRHIRSLVGEPKWEQFRSGFLNDFLNMGDPQGALNRLDNWTSRDRAGLRLLLSDVEEKTLRDYMIKRIHYENSPAYKTMAENLTNAERQVKLIHHGSVQDTVDLIRLSGGEKGKVAQALKAGVYKDILDQATRTSRTGEQILDPQEILNRMNWWKKGGKLDVLFDAADWQRVEDFRKYAGLLTETVDVGGGMMAGSVRQNVVQGLPDLLTSPSGAAKIASGITRPLGGNAFWAIILTQPKLTTRLPTAGANIPKRLRALTTMVTVGLEEQRRGSRGKQPPTE